MIDIKCSDDMEAFIYQVDGLHDALLHEMAWAHPGWVDTKGLMYGDVAKPSIEMIFQSQWAESPAIKLEIDGVISFRMDCTDDFKLEGDVKPDLITLYLQGRENAKFCEIRAARARYEILGLDYRGRNYSVICRPREKWIKYPGVDED